MCLCVGDRNEGWKSGRMVGTCPIGLCVYGGRGGRPSVASIGGRGDCWDAADVASRDRHVTLSF